MRRASGRGGEALGIMLCAVLVTSAWACGPKAPGPTQLLVSEGGSDEKRDFGATPPLGNPPSIDATAPAADFLIEVSKRIQPAWKSFLEDCRIRLPPSHPLNDSKLLARLELTINGQGSVLGVNVVHSSGNADFDAVAREILSDLQTLPKPPPEWVTGDDQVLVGWKFARDIRQASSAGGSIQRVILPIGEALEKLLEAGAIAQAGQRVLDAGGRSIPVPQVEAILYRSLELAMSEEDPTLKARALHIVAAAKLAALGDQARAFVHSTDENVALAATIAIGSIGDTRDIETLEAFAMGIRPASVEIRAAAAASLATLGRGPQVTRRAASNLRSPDGELRLAAVAVLSNLVLESGKAVGDLSKILMGGTKASRPERALAARALGRQAPQHASALKALLSGTGSPDAIVRTSCVEAIAAAAKAGMTSRVAYWKVLELVRNRDERVRAAAIVALAALDPARFARELRAVRAGGSKLVVLSMAGVLGDLPGSVALSRLLDLAGLPDVGMRVAAATGLARRPGDQAEIALQSLRADTAPAVRTAALASVTSEEQLRPFLQDASTDVQAVALSALTVQLGKDQTAKIVATMLAETGSDRALQLLWAEAWLAPGR